MCCVSLRAPIADELAAGAVIAAPDLEGKGPSLLDYDLRVGQAQAPVRVVLGLGTAHLYCAEFGGVLKDGSDGKTFLAKDASAPPSCP